MSDIVRAATAMLDAYEGDVPDWLLEEANALAMALAVEQIEREPVNHYAAAIEHMRAAMAHLRQAPGRAGSRLASELAAVQNMTDRAAGRATPATPEREAARLAGWPDPVGGE